MKIPVPTFKRKARIEIIPLIDIVFFLLATFVMVSMSMVKSQGIQVKLPRALTAAAEKEKSATTLTVTEDGRIYADKAPVHIADLPTYLRGLIASDPDPKVLINGDERASFGEAVRVLDEVRKAGIAKVSIQTASRGSD